jgi:exodeoxyribonuclease VII large subunit
MEPTILHVGDYLSLLNEVLHDRVPSNKILIEGEISDYRVSQGKWVSFDLKDEHAEAVLKCFATVWQITTPIEDGMRVHVTGFPKMYERFGMLKLNVQTIEPVGEGALKRAYELLKKKLQVEGLFDISRKRTLVRFPKKIGLITSRDAAAYGDFLRIVNNRWGGVEILFAHVHVQGREAVPEILDAFRHFNTLPIEEHPDAIVLTRGGGGLEDLHAFNDEQVARAVYQSSIPVVVAVGHERDESLCDFVADVRASTPSNAAERVVPSRTDVVYEINTMLQHHEHQLQFVMDEYRTATEKVAMRVGHILERERERLMTIKTHLQDQVGNWLPTLRDAIESSARLLRQVDPTRVLARGYAIVRVGGNVIQDASALAIGKELAIQLGCGSVDAEVLRVNGKGKQKSL